MANNAQIIETHTIPEESSDVSSEIQETNEKIETMDTKNDELIITNEYSGKNQLDDDQKSDKSSKNIKQTSRQSDDENGSDKQHPIDDGFPRRVFVVCASLLAVVVVGYMYRR